MNKTTIKTNQNNVVKGRNFEEIVSNMTLELDPAEDKLQLEKAFNKLMSATSADDKKSAQKLIDALIEKNRDLYFYIEKHVLLMESVHWNDDLSYFSVAADLAEQLKKEYKCSTPSEITLCQMIANAYVRTMRLSKVLLGYIGIPQEISNLKNTYYGNISKELDRAERQYYTGLNNLVALRRPNLQVNIKTNNAFVAQNQQLNNTNENNRL